MAYNWRETTPLYASISGVLAGFSITFIVFLLREDQSSQQIAYGVSWVSLAVLMMGASAVLFIQASQYFLTAKDHDVSGMLEDKRGNLSEEAKKVELTKAFKNVRLGGLLYNVGRVTLFLGVAFAVLPFFPVVAVLIGAGGIGFELYQIASAKKPAHETEPAQATSRARKRARFKIYGMLTTGAVLLVILNYVFTKLIDLIYGNFNAASVAIDTLVFVFFIFLFTVYIWAIDVRGYLAHIMGARDEDQ